MDSVIKRRIIIGSDHAGFKLKEIIKQHLSDKNKFDILDVGTNSTDSCDFPDYAEKLSEEVIKDKNNRGILVCGSGIGVSIVANKFQGIRCALVHDYLTTKLAREHTDCNVISMGESIIGVLQAKTIVDTFLETENLKEEKYLRRINKISSLESKLVDQNKNI